MIKIGLLGLGTVGEAFVKNFYNHPLSKIARIESILLQNKNKRRAIDTSSISLTTDPNDIINNEEIDLVIELIGGEQPALDYILTSLSNNKHVITANKCVVALYLDQLLDKAKANNVNFAYEASVAGGIPILRTLLDGMHSNHITQFMGICNGTSNYIISRMLSDKLDFNTVLTNAQELGFAEADSSLDVDGYDASYKTSILSSLCFKHYSDYSKVHREGISNISLLELEQADRLGYRIKPVVYGKLENSTISQGVFLALISKNNIMAHVDGVDNIVQLESDLLGKTSYIGPGAGGDATSASVITDLANILEREDLDQTFYSNIDNNFNYKDIEDTDFKYFISLTINNRHNINTSIHNENKVKFINKLNDIFHKYHISVFNLYFVEHDLDSEFTHIIILTNEISSDKINKLESYFKGLENIDEYNFIRILE